MSELCADGPETAFWEVAIVAGSVSDNVAYQVVNAPRTTDNFRVPDNTDTILSTL